MTVDKYIRRSEVNAYMHKYGCLLGMFYCKKHKLKIILRQ